MHRKRYGVFAGWLSLLAAVTFLGGCSTILVFDPKGPIGEVERFVIIAAIVLMLIVLIPVFLMDFWFPLKYRASNTASTYQPKWSYSAKIDFFMWAVPIAIVTVLSVLSWTETHHLDPYKPIPSSRRPINIEAVSLDWKWLFIYPDQNIATVNQITFPVQVPVSFKITSATVMTSLFIPQLGGMMDAMAGMQTQLNLLADKAGVYAGHNQQFSGRGFAAMHFEAHAVSPEEFQSWLEKIRQSPEKLDLGQYEKLARPSLGYPVTYFSQVKPGLFEDILRQFNPTWGRHPAMGAMNRGSVSPPAGTGVSEEN